MKKKLKKKASDIMKFGYKTIPIYLQLLSIIYMKASLPKSINTVKIAARTETQLSQFSSHQGDKKN